ncbi:MAG: enoyl-CoA hydratase/isomerase family protein [Solirubrobacteraceae bacterium]|nr:enoyl-CoA hydratase/isomerase family protein [Solirubrobacteraceae bacterium]
MSGQLRKDTPAPGVLRLRISNPAKRGALDHPILDGIADALDTLDPSVRCVLLTGEQGVFSSGYDIGNIPADRTQDIAEPLVAHPFASALEALDRTDIPTVAALSGHTIGGGLELAVACDIRIARDDIKLGMPPAKLGLIYSHTGLQRFIDAIGEPRTRDLFFRGRTITAARAEHWGLVTEVVAAPTELGHKESEQEHAAALDEASVKLAAEVAGNSPLSIQGNKRQLRALLNQGRQLPADIEEQLLAERRACFQSEDFLEGVTAFAERRKPVWKGR